MELKDIHIGKLIEQKADELGINKSEIARRINTTRQNMDNILAKKSIDTFRLTQISKVLNFDFFQYYTSAISKANIDKTQVNEPASNYLQLNRNKVSVYIEINDPEKENSILKMVLGENIRL